MTGLRETKTPLLHFNTPAACDGVEPVKCAAWSLVCQSMTDCAVAHRAVSFTRLLQNASIPPQPPVAANFHSFIVLLLLSQSLAPFAGCLDCRHSGAAIPSLSNNTFRDLYYEKGDKNDYCLRSQTCRAPQC